MDRAIIAKELTVATLGGAHQGSFLIYFLYLAVDLLPRTPIVACAGYAAISHCRRDHRLAALLI